MNKRGLLFVSILLILVSSAYALPDCNTRCKNQNQNYLFGQCGTESEMSKEGWENIGKTPCTGEQSCFCKKSVQITTQSTSQTNMASNPSTPTEISNVDYFVIPNGLSGNSICKSYGGYCDSIQCRVDLSLGLFNPIYRWATVGCLRTGCDTNIENKPEGWARAYCSCSYDKFCNGVFVYEKKNTCQEILVENCADKNMKCSGGECADCIDGYYEEKGVCIYGTRPTTKTSGTEPPITPPVQDSECTKLCKTSAYNADIGYCLNLEKPQRPLSASIGTNPERINNRKINIDAQALIFTNQQKNCIGLITNDPGNQQDNEFEACFCVECGTGKEWSNEQQKCIISSIEPSGVTPVCGDGKIEGNEQCDCGDPVKGDIWCFKENLNSNSEYCSSSSLTITPKYPNARLSCYPPGSSKECQYNTQGCDNNRIPCFIDATCNSGEKCHPTEYYCYVPPSTCGNGIVEGVEQCDCKDDECASIELGLPSDSCLSYYNAKSYYPENRPYPNKKVSCFPSTSSNELKCKWNAQGCNAGKDVCLKDSDCQTGEYCDLQNYYCKQKATTPNACQLTSASISLSDDKNSNNQADQGDIISIVAVLDKPCSNLKKVQIDASEKGDTNGQCVINNINGKIKGISGDTSLGVSGIYLASWIIPSIPSECQGKTIIPYSVGLYSGEISSPNYIQAGTIPPTGSFTFASALGGGQTKCGDGAKDAGEVCDKQLTPTTSCISINPDLYSSGIASCKEDCSGWDIITCIQKTITTGCGNGAIDSGENCDCETDNACTLTELGLQGDSCLYYYNAKSYSPENRPYPNKKVSCFPSTSSNELKCKWNAQGCNSGYDVCLKDADCSSGKYCDLSVDYCKQKCSQDEPCIMDGCTGKKICNTQTGILSNTCTKYDPTCQPPVTPACTELTCATLDGCPGKNRCVNGILSTECTKDNPICPTIILDCASQSDVDLSTASCKCEGIVYSLGWCCKGKYQGIPCDQTPTSEFSVRFTYEIEGTTVTFTSSNPLLKYFEWDFGDQSEKKAGEDLYTVSHTYIFDGSEKSFTVNLTAHNSEGKTATASNVIKIEKSISDLPNTEKCNARGDALCHSSLDGCFLNSKCESCAVVSTCDDFSNDELACTGEIPGCDRYACDWDNGNVCLPKQVSEQDCQYVCINLNDYPNYYFNGKKEYPQTCETGTCWECPTEGCKFTSPDGTTTITYIDGECVNGFKEVTIKNSGIAQDQTIIQPCSLSPVISFFTLFNIILTLSILTIFYIFRKKF